MSDLYHYFDENPGRLILKWGHYFGVYERHFAAYRNKPVRLLEYGVFHGGSLQMWRHFFGPQAEIIGVDIDPRCADLAEPGIAIELGDQADPALHARLREKYGSFDIVIDDGGHQMHQQIVTFREMYPAVKPGGVYLVEDLHTSYLADWGGGYRRPDTFIEFSKNFIDQLYAWYPSTPEHRADLLTATAYGLHFYDSMLVIEKRDLPRPTQLGSGRPVFPIGAVEYLLLAEHDFRKKRFAEAIEKCRLALQHDPANARARALLQACETALANPV